MTDPAPMDEPDERLPAPATRALPHAAPRRRASVTAAWRVAFVLLFVTVAWLAFTPRPPPVAESLWDKANHLLAFAALAFTAAQGWDVRAPGRRTAGVAAGLLAWGIAIECVQALIPERSASAADVAADAAGIALGLAAAFALAALRRHGREPSGPRGLTP